MTLLSWLSTGSLPAYEAGIIVGIIAPLLGIFLVTRRYSYLADTLAHVSLAGAAISLITGMSLILSALCVSILAAVSVEEIRYRRRVFGESALVIFLSGGLAVAAVLLSLAEKNDFDLESLLFGNIENINSGEVAIIVMLGAVVLATVILLFKELVSISLDEEMAEAGGLPVRILNLVFVILAAIMVSVSIRVVGVLLIGALMVIPVSAAIQLRTGFKKTLFIAIGISLFSVVTGLLVSDFLAISSGGTIVLVALGIFLLSLLIKHE